MDFIRNLLGDEPARISGIVISMVTVPVLVWFIKDAIIYLEVYFFPRIILPLFFFMLGSYGIGSVFYFFIMGSNLFDGVNIYWVFSSLAMTFVILDLMVNTE